MSVRLFHRDARLVFVVRRFAAGDERWWSPHIAIPDWCAIFSAQLTLLGLDAGPDARGSSLSCRLGHIGWTTSRRWSMIVVRLTKGSDTKRRLVAGALLRAARYARFT
jgi:hypothetical protein